MGELINAVIFVGKAIGGAKAVKNVSDVFTTNWEEKQRERERQRERQERSKKVSEIEKGNIFETVLIYFVGMLFAKFIWSLGVIGIVFVILGYLTQASELYKLKDYVDLKREWILTAISAAIVVML